VANFCTTDRSKAVFLFCCSVYFEIDHFINYFLLGKKVKYAYQELPHSEDTASPHSQEEEK
jgi:hypothetical protein